MDLSSLEWAAAEAGGPSRLLMITDLSTIKSTQLLRRMNFGSCICHLHLFLSPSTLRFEDVRVVKLDTHDDLVAERSSRTLVPSYQPLLHNPQDCSINCSCDFRSASCRKHDLNKMNTFVEYMCVLVALFNCAIYKYTYSQFFYTIGDELTLRSCALLLKPPIVQPLEKFPAFYGT
jgi:hypothetical protein